MLQNSSVCSPVPATYSNDGSGIMATKPATIVDLRAKLNGTAWKDGKTVIYRDRAIELVAEAKDGAVINVTPVNISGSVMHVTARSDPAKRWCIFCYNLDQPLASTCIEVPCWMLPLLKMVTNAGATR